MTRSTNESASQEARTAGLSAALASTASRTLALYFSRPIRLFRPPKISGWHTLRGQSLPLLIKQNGCIPRHFLPPLIVNALLGTVLWTTYAEASALLGARYPGSSELSPIAVAALSGGCAGSVQALAAAPAENVRIVLEGGRFRGSWSVAWKEVFAGAESISQTQAPAHAAARHRSDVREVRRWVREARAMAGRGWHGLGFGVAKDSCGFTVFFAIFELSRRTAARARAFSERVSNALQSVSADDSSPAAAAAAAAPRAKVAAHVPRVVHSTTIVTGGLLAGLSYELVCRPFDAARRCIHIAAIERHHHHHLPRWRVLANKLSTDGVLSFFRDPVALSSSSSSPLSSSSPSPSPSGAANTVTWLRMLGRVGPWGVAFLAWESFGPDSRP